MRNGRSGAPSQNRSTRPVAVSSRNTAACFRSHTKRSPAASNRAARPGRVWGPDPRGGLRAAQEGAAGRVNPHPEAEAACRAALLESPPPRVEPIDLPALAAAPHVAVSVDGDALGVVELE